MPELASPFLTPRSSARARGRGGARRRDRRPRLQRGSRPRDQHPPAAPLPHDGFPFTWRIVIADNASVDATPEIARRLAPTLPRVRHLRLERKGRGRALRAAWSASPAKVVTYMDVDLSTDLRGLLPLVAPLMSGHSRPRDRHPPRPQLAGRARPQARVHLAQLQPPPAHVAAREFTDAQCGFKSVRRDVLDPLLDDVRDEGWFFDTELLVLAQRRGLRIHEVPVDWVDDPDSRVEIVHTAIHRPQEASRGCWAADPIAHVHGHRRAQHDRLRRPVSRASCR